MPENDLTLFGRKLNAVRGYLESGLSQQQFAIMTLTNQCSISRMENGLEEPKFSFLERVSNLSRIPVEYFFTHKSYGDFLGMIVEIENNRKNHELKSRPEKSYH